MLYGVWMIYDRFTELCSAVTSSWLSFTYFTSDIGIALAYYSIPIQMLIVLRDRKKDLPYPWLWVLFVLFIAACGTTHAWHAFAALSVGETWSEAVIRLFTSTISIGTAVALAFVIPQARKIRSPAEVQAALEATVAQRTRELQRALEDRDAVVMEMHHRVGNIAQIAESIITLRERPNRDRRELTETALERMRALSTDAVGISGISGPSRALVRQR
jgi:hypothetical protein